MQLNSFLLPLSDSLNQISPYSGKISPDSIINLLVLKISSRNAHGFLCFYLLIDIDKGVGQKYVWWKFEVLTESFEVSHLTGNQVNGTKFPLKSIKFILSQSLARIVFRKFSNPWRLKSLISGNLLHFIHQNHIWGF